MIAYFDTSAFAPMILDEPAADRCRHLWDRSERVTSTRLLFVEASSALARASRLGRIGEHGLEDGLGVLVEKWPQVAISEIDRELMIEAAAMVHRFGLRGYDAVHCAAAVRIDDDEVVAASGDRHLLEAWSELGLNTFNANR